MYQGLRRLLPWEFSEWCLPCRHMIPAPHRSLSHPARTLQKIMLGRWGPSLDRGWRLYAKDGLNRLERLSKTTILKDNSSVSIEDGFVLGESSCLDLSAKFWEGRAAWNWDLFYLAVASDACSATIEYQKQFLSKVIYSCTRIAPTKAKLSMPKKESNGLSIACKKAEYQRNILKINKEYVYIHCDSLVFLYWVKHDPDKLIHKYTLRIFAHSSLTCHNVNVGLRCVTPFDS